MTMTTLVQEAGRKVEEGTHEMGVVGANRQLDITKWDPMNEVETAKAKAIFDRLKDGGYQTYSQPNTGEGELIRDFDPQAEHIVAAAPLQGG